jgi:hypothetical protein
MKTAREFVVLFLIVCASGQALGQATPPAAQPWEYNVVVDGYIIPDGTSYVDPVFTADHNWLHLEARYNYENLHTGSLWVGYNFSWGKKVQFSLTPMIGGIFGRSNGIAPGGEASLTYKRIQGSISNEYVFDTDSKSRNFYYTWPQLTYSPVEWLHVGAVAQRTKVYHTPLDTQRGFLVGVSHKNWDFTTYVFNPGASGTIVVLEAGVSF